MTLLHELVSHALALAALLLMLLGGPTLVRLLVQLHARTKDSRVQLLLEVLARSVAALVAKAQQRVVADLKDPTRPGAWSPRAAELTREAVLAEARAALADVLGELRAAGRLDVEVLLPAMLETAVLEQKARGLDPPRPPGPPPPPPLGPDGETPAETPVAKASRRPPGAPPAAGDP